MAARGDLEAVGEIVGEAGDDEGRAGVQADEVAPRTALAVEEPAAPARRFRAASPPCRSASAARSSPSEAGSTSSRRRRQVPSGSRTDSIKR